MVLIKVRCIRDQAMTQAEEPYSAAEKEAAAEAKKKVSKQLFTEELAIAVRAGVRSY